MLYKYGNADRVEACLPQEPERVGDGTLRDHPTGGAE